MATLSSLTADGPPTSDFSQPFAFHLPTRKPNKTVDIGKNGVSLSLDAFGRVLQASTFHPQHGIMVAVPFEQFDGNKFYDPSYVRNYRTHLLRRIQHSEPGFGLDFGPGVEDVAIQIQDANLATFAFDVDKGLHVTMEVEVLETGEICQTATVTNSSSTTSALEYDLSLCVSLNRASYGQLTEGGPVPLPESWNRLQRDGQSIISITNPALSGQLALVLEADRKPIYISNLKDQEARNAPLDVRISKDLVVPAGQNSTVRARFRLLPDAHSHISFDTLPSAKGRKMDRKQSWKKDDTLTTYILRRNVEYILANCIVPMSATETCVITDHVALPLGWNRDNYWQMRLLLETYKHRKNLFSGRIIPEYAEKIHNTVKGYLNWVFKAAQRPYGYWHRSYLVTGAPKDHSIFQLDQQCYPLSELCDYLKYFPEDIDFIKEIIDLGVVDEILQLLESKRDRETGLWPTDETPGDDAVTYPHHFSSHVLLWRTFTRLKDLFSRIRSPTHNSVQRMDALASGLRARVMASFISTHPETGEQVFAYLTNGHGSYTFYHDANDIPTLFTPEWSFVSMPEEVSIWSNTMAFAFSSLNSTGYCDEGLYAGLGSVHSPGAWVLGYFQELEYAVFSEDDSMMKETWRKIAAAMQWDGTFSEAVDTHTAECSSKAWFSWPGAMIGALIIKLRNEGLEDMLVP